LSLCKFARLQVCVRLCKFMWGCASLFETVQVYVRLCKFVFTAICIPILITATPLEYLLLYYCYITAICTPIFYCYMCPYINYCYSTEILQSIQKQVNSC
jgi:hypothetical protein